MVIYKQIREAKVKIIEFLFYCFYNMWLSFTEFCFVYFLYLYIFYFYYNLIDFEIDTITKMSSEQNNETDFTVGKMSFSHLLLFYIIHPLQRNILLSRVGLFI